MLFANAGRTNRIAVRAIADPDFTVLDRRFERFSEAHKVGFQQTLLLAPQGSSAIGETWLSVSSWSLARPWLRALWLLDEVLTIDDNWGEFLFSEMLFLNWEHDKTFDISPRSMAMRLEGFTSRIEWGLTSKGLERSLVISVPRPQLGKQLVYRAAAARPL